MNNIECKNQLTDYDKLMKENCRLDCIKHYKKYNENK